MENQRLFLWLGFLFIVWLNVQAWMKDYSAPDVPATTAAAQAQQPASTLGNDVPAVVPAAALPAAPPAPAATTLGDVPAATAAAAPDAAVPAAPVAPVAPVAQTISVRTDVLSLEISTEGGQFTGADLLKYPVDKSKPDMKVRLFNSGATGVEYLFQSGLTTGVAGRAEPNHKAIFTAAATSYMLADGQDTLSVPLTWTDGAGLTVMKTYVFKRGSYAVDIVQAVQNGTAAAVQISPYAQFLRHWEHHERSMFDVESYAFRGPAVYDGEKYQKLDVENEDDVKFARGVTGGWIATMQHHFVGAFVPAAGQSYQFTLAVQNKDFLLRAAGPAQSIAPGATTEIREKLFVGPKLQAQLKTAGPRLELTADYGKLTILSQPLFWLLEQVYKLFGNWGWSIIVVTLLIKLVFYKLSETSGRSMAKMRTVAPRIKAMQERYKDDREQQAKQLMELYKREKINPVAGCLPMLVQIPFFLAFYWVLLESVEMRQAPFMFWIQDLSTRDPYFILPLLMGAAMFAQFKLNPQPPDPVQAKVFAFMPVVMTVMFAWFPSGLVLYWLTNTGLSIAQQWKINHAIEAEAKKQRAS
ncbi:MAG: membrane protein insertase YidC [Gammaproteobacteria bacterium]|nr:membrane protein insertase YidC [Gammaproteobacteria bacterium]